PPGEAGATLRALLLFLLLAVGAGAAAALRGRRTRLALGLRQVAVLGRPEDPRDVVTLERLDLDERVGQRLELVPVLGEDAAAELVRLVDRAADLLVDLLGGALGVVALLGVVAAEERRGLAAPEGARAHPVAHAPLRDHGAGDLRHLADVVV